MAESRVAGRYAKALLDLAHSTGKTDEVCKDMSDLSKTIEGSREFDLLLKSPIVNFDKKSKIFNEIFKGKMEDVSFDFLSLILKKRREADIGDIAKSYLYQYNQLNQVTTVRLISAEPLSQENQEKIVARLKEQTNLKEIELETSVDASLMGGFIVEYGDTVMDASVKSSLNKIGKRFASGV